jgi:2-dehydro-3-deoxyphosphogluconate aldolase/(4S)-4-hydroxy-2-oxoglutarate aldolase
MNDIIDQIGLLGILPIATINDVNKAAQLANTLYESGLPTVEVTFRTKTAHLAIEQIIKESPKILVGAGTILSVEDVEKAVNSGARFIISPGFNPKVIEYCLYKSIPVIPGVLTPTEIQYAIDHGLKVVKLFPMEAVGGLPYLKSIAAPFKDLKYIPTGGINDSNLLSYLRFPKVLACAGSWMIQSEMLEAGQFQEIGSLAKQAVATMLGFELKHVGMNLTSADEARNIAGQLENLFQFSSRDTDGSIFVGSQFRDSAPSVEVLKKPNHGDHGHIAIATNFIERAIAYLALKGVRIKSETINEKDGKLKTVYLDLELGGFAIHLVQV